VSSAAAATLILIAVAAFGLPLVARRVGVPAPVLEILFGVAIGPVLHFVTLTDFISQLGELGFFLLMFLSGFEINLAGFGARARSQLVVGLVVFGITLAASAGSVWLLGYGAFTMFVLATTSVGMVVPTLRTTRHMGTSLGQSILVSALIADFLTLIAVTCLALVTDSGSPLSLLAVPAFFAVIAAGLLNKQVAHRLGISPKTVSSHLEHIYAKTGVATRAGATLFAMEHGLVGPVPSIG